MSRSVAIGGVATAPAGGVGAIPGAVVGGTGVAIGGGVLGLFHSAFADGPVEAAGQGVKDGIVSGVFSGIPGGLAARAEIASSAGVAGSGAADLLGGAAAKTIAELAPDVADNAFVHFAPQAIEGGEARVSTYFFKFADIKKYTPAQVQTIIGGLATGGQQGGAKVMSIVCATAGDFTARPDVLYGLEEYISSVALKVVKTVVVQ